MPDLDEATLQRAVDGMLRRRPSVGLAVGVVRAGAPTVFVNRGVADVTSRTPVTEDTVFRVASITKTFTAIAVTQLWEAGLVDLDAPVEEYLRSYRLLPARPGHRPATLRHLLTHTAGVGEEPPGTLPWRRDFGESVRPGRRVPSLAEYYRGALRLDAEPGTRFRYTDHGIATAGQVVEDVSGMPLADYLRERVFDPLGMVDTEVVRSEALRSRSATGYTLGSHGPRPVTDRDWVTAAASMAVSTPRDMARYLAALLGGGANEHGTILRPDSMRMMFAPQYQPDPRIPGLGLGFYRANVGDHPVVEHQGILPGFDSQVFVAPQDGLGVMAFSNGTRRGMLWIPTELSCLLESLLDVPPESARPDVPQRPDVWGELCGWYHLPGPMRDARVRGMVGAGVEVLVRRGQLVLRVLSPLPVLYRGLPLLPDDPTDPYAFRLDLTDFGLGSVRVVFGRDAAADTMVVHLDLMPLTAYRRSEATHPRRWLQAAGAAALAALVGRRVRQRTGG